MTLNRAERVMPFDVKGLFVLICHCMVRNNGCVQKAAEFEEKSSSI